MAMYEGLDMDMGNKSHGGMVMTFHFGYHEKVLIDQWHITNVAGLIGSMVVLMVIAIIYEVLKYVREHLSRHNGRGSRATQSTIWSKMHCMQTLLHLIQLTLSYLLMLIFMTYNAWLCIAVVLGSTIGYFLVGWKRTGFVDSTEHCQ
ncbi:hypothetical protein WA026_020073 [Henosepilachna vigintioctopunctata]|uniref:Copper transport protein n=1 Tax=Henosepilachna vigintioctopunctata TaxID=420089 RepID=A0AAW1U201_9CUCU